jgi:hypothetical protein
VEQHPEEYLEDLNPHYEEGENHGSPRYATRLAVEIKEIQQHLPGLSNDQLRQIPILIEGSRLEQGAIYLDLRDLDRGEFKAMGSMAAGEENWYVPKSEVDHELWNFLTGETDTYRLGAQAR